MGRKRERLAIAPTPAPIKCFLFIFLLTHVMLQEESRNQKKLTKIKRSNIN